MFITLEDDFFPEELSIKQQILKYSDLVDRSIRSWKTRAKLRIRTARRLEKRIICRKEERLSIWYQKQTRLVYRLKGVSRLLFDRVHVNLGYLFFFELWQAYKTTTMFLFFKKPCYKRRLKKKTVSNYLFT